MKWSLDSFLLIGIAFCWALRQAFAADGFSKAGGFLLLVFIIRLAGSAIGWILNGR